MIIVVAAAVVVVNLAAVVVVVDVVVVVVVVVGVVVVVVVGGDDDDRSCPGRQMKSLLILMRAEMVNNLRGIAIDPTDSEYRACVDRFSGQIQS